MSSRLIDKVILKISELEFSRGTHAVKEIIHQKREGVYSLFWIRQPIDSLQLDGRGNPFFSSDYSILEPGITKIREEASRRRVSEAYDAYWKIGESNDPAWR